MEEDHRRIKTRSNLFERNLGLVQFKEMIVMNVEFFEFEVFGIPYIKFRNLNSFEDFNLIVKIIENKD